MDAPIEVHPGIFVRENFLTPEEVDTIYTYASSLTLDDWRKRGDDTPSINTLGLSGVVLERLYEIFDPTENVVRNFSRIQSREPSPNSLVHYARMREDERCIQSCLIMVNDNYEGGEIVFVNQDNFTIKPAAGSIIYFSPEVEYAFMIAPITGDISRYAIPEDIYVVEPDQPSLVPLNS